jgi:hypothetical protein
MSSLSIAYHIPYTPKPPPVSTPDAITPPAIHPGGPEHISAIPVANPSIPPVIPSEPLTLVLFL